MPLLKLALPFDHPDYIFELKYDGFRALAVIEHGHAQLLSRNGHPFASFTELGKQLAAALPNVSGTVLDGEIVCIDKKGKPQFKDLLFHRSDPCFFAFDLLAEGGKDVRAESLMDRKQELRRLLMRVPSNYPLKYADHVDGCGTALFQRVCQLDLEGIVAKHKAAPYVSDREHSTWFKIRNPHYSQWAGREELFERERRRAGIRACWHGRKQTGETCTGCPHDSGSGSSSPLVAFHVMALMD